MLVHLPTHASWLNQIEIYFSILARKALTPCGFATHRAAALTTRVPTSVPLSGRRAMRRVS
jgi:hypothetical protein